MEVGRAGEGQFSEVVLRPRVTIAARSGAEMKEKAQLLHRRAHELCFIARSVTFAVRCEGVVEVG
jgi:organic hydroperoxide reductase OsmC/OhrA